MGTLIFESGNVLLVDRGAYVLVSKQIENVAVGEIMILDSERENLYKPKSCSSEIVAKIEEEHSVLINKNWIQDQDAVLQVRDIAGFSRPRPAQKLQLGDRWIRDEKDQDVIVTSLERY